MLNTAEAARFLRVSQASIRRWSDSGLLPGRRVGRRRERRFMEADLVAFMDRSITATASSPTVMVAGTAIAVPTHLATFFSTGAGGLRLTVPFLADGVRLHQPCFLAGSAEVHQRYFEALGGGGGITAVQFQGGSAAEAIAHWEDTFAAAVANGATVIRVVGEMAYERAMFANEEEMLRYEEAFDMMSRRYPTASICQYDVREFDGVALLRALKAHPDLFDLRIGPLLN